MKTLLVLILAFYHLSLLAMDGGQVVNDRAFRSIVLVEQSNQKDNATSLCTGVLISKSEVLTSAHCFDEDTQAKNIKIKVGNSSDDFESFEVENFVIHPEYAIDEAYDFAYIRLKNQIGSIELQEIIPLLSKEDGFTYRQLMNKEAELVGFGGQDKDDFLSAGIKKVGTSKISGVVYISEFKSILSLELSSKTIYAHAHEGDSGGPIIVELNGQKKIVAITHGEITEDPKSISSHQFVLQVEDWIQQNLSSNID